MHMYEHTLTFSVSYADIIILPLVLFHRMLHFPHSTNASSNRLGAYRIDITQSQSMELAFVLPQPRATLYIFQRLTDMTIRVPHPFAIEIPFHLTRR